MRFPALTAGMLAAAALAWHAAPSFAEPARRVPAPAIDLPASPTMKYDTAVFAGGCFWGVQGVFQRVKGVNNAVSGYAGGDAKTARYEHVGSGRTGHAEAVRITYDPRQISYGKLLQIYFSVAHDPTQLNRQGPDTGPQYRSTVFAENAEQAHIAKAYIVQLNQARTFGKPLATTIEMGKPFYAAEAYHQDFLTRHPGNEYIVFNDLPKIEGLKKLFPESYRPTPVLVNAAKGG
ncbi:peptide-methionine (S)-S-oxide reductase [Variovorax beijingensis]|jgi:peptide-methionine (S)-S-oxide reductase|uniref:Peptide methionine sulfoxide reductase MsrA n=2 Tax=Variovorax TaxID=34072 RepID=A0AAE4BZJ6_VARPD|nr:MULTISPECIES: peptide-methionine (S)-S-oxide reductase MsrA [Variovorax]MBD9665807.1 peptide-methionine (S)-S-oxide reductase MsrA [Variovorax sp. VRV01]MDP9968537.1 peptide-methionine (S)-S-oxide reductase [Variovorax paradoxus]MDR6429033.1 peptide-methionine (S)-S-oxide reductase [Variovorax paradoxus]MDR6453738.1 peptide-methionine (S)-S-oxide reductase [Variovorax paradoxus]TWD86510.1 peptide-methionine (S)-S-oxide reductase [Variovorax beijingensis]